MAKVALKEFKKLLTQRGLNCDIQEETEQLYILFEIMGKHFPLFIKIVNGNKLIQFLIFLPIALKEDYIVDTARILHYLNKEVDLPGFCLDEQNNIIFYRLVLPVANDIIDDGVFVTLVRACQVACESAAASIVAISQGSMRFPQFMASAEEAKRKLSEEPPHKLSEEPQRMLTEEPKRKLSEETGKG